MIGVAQVIFDNRAAIIGNTEPVDLILAGVLLLGAAVNLCTGWRRSG